MYKRIKETANALEFLDRIANGIASLTGGESPYAIDPTFYQMLVDSPDGLEISLHPDSTFAVSYGIYRDDTDLERPATELGNFQTKLSIGAVSSPFSVDFGTLFALATNGGKAVIKAYFVPAKPGKEAPTYKSGALVGKRLINLTPAKNKVLDAVKDTASVKEYLLTLPAFAKATTAPAVNGG